MTISKNFVVISLKTENLSKFEQQTLLSSTYKKVLLMYWIKKQKEY